MRPGHPVASHRGRSKSKSKLCQPHIFRMQRTARSWSRTRTPKVRQMHPGQRFEIQISVAASKSPVCLASEYICIASSFFSFLFSFFCCFRRCFFWSNFWLVLLSVLSVKMSQENSLYCGLFSICHFVIYFVTRRVCIFLLFQFRTILSICLLHIIILNWKNVTGVSSAKILPLFRSCVITLGR